MDEMQAGVGGAASEAPRTGVDHGVSNRSSDVSARSIREPIQRSKDDGM